MTHILICNQHGENRGDEAAMRAMLAAFAKAIPNVTFTLLYQFRDPSLRLHYQEPVQALPIVLPATTYLRGGLFTLCKALRINAGFLLPEALRRIIAAYERADLVVSAPGGPYFGDLYAGHELAHWWYILLGRLHERPLFLYAPSAGPFKKCWLNPIRRWLFHAFDMLTVREEISAQHIRQLLGSDTRIEVTADSAIQSSFSPYPRDQYFSDAKAALREHSLIAVSLNDYHYPGSRNPAEMKAKYNRVMTACLNYLAGKTNAHFLFFPQLYGAVHSDVNYLLNMGESLAPELSWELVNPALDSTMQRRLFAMCNLHVSSRYHPAIFGFSALVPGICIYYEHKALGFMQQLGLDRFTFDIWDIRQEDLKFAIDELFDTREELVLRLRQRLPLLQHKAQRTTELAIKLLSTFPRR